MVDQPHWVFGYIKFRGGNSGASCSFLSSLEVVRATSSCWLTCSWYNMYVYIYIYTYHIYIIIFMCPFLSGVNLNIAQKGAQKWNQSTCFVVMFTGAWKKNRFQMKNHRMNHRIYSPHRTLTRHYQDEGLHFVVREFFLINLSLRKEENPRYIFTHINWLAGFFFISWLKHIQLANFVLFWFVGITFSKFQR